MNLDELADVLLPVLVERLSPADILISQSRDGSTENKIDLTKMDQNLSRCKRQLTWIKNNAKSIDENEPPEKTRRAVLTLNPDDPDEGETVMFDDENHLEIGNVQLELKLVLDCLKMLKTSTDNINENEDILSSGFYKNFRRFDLGKSTWSAVMNMNSNLDESHKKEFFERVSSLVDTNSEYIFSATAHDSLN